jgi:hypothetical protein
MHEREDPMTNPLQTGTDLPLSPGGNNGNTSAAPSADSVANIERWFADAIETLPEPPFEVLSTQAVIDWIEQATANLQFRRERQHLLREALRALERDFRSALAGEALRERLDRLQARLSARAAGTYWRERDSRRSATQATHLVVDSEAWDQARLEAMTNRSSVGVVVGPLVVAEVRMPVERDWTRDAARDPRHEIRRFTRLAVPREIYAKVRVLASRADVTVERYLGVVVEEAFPSKADGR